MTMRIIIAGGRDFTDYRRMEFEMDRLLEKQADVDITIISGTANGADKTGELYAERRGLQIIRMPANWKLHGKSAGYKRNAEMAERATHVVCFWDKESRGTKHMIDLARTKKLPQVTFAY